MAKTQESVAITGAQTSLREDQRIRTRRYLYSMALRTMCFIGAVVTTGWIRWALVVGAVFLPYIAVVAANAGRRKQPPAPPALILDHRGQLGAKVTE